MAMVEKDILGTIVERKHQEVSSLRMQAPIFELKARIREQDKPRSFVGALKKRIYSKQAAIIAEVKKASPSKGVIRKDCLLYTSPSPRD